LGFIGGSMLIMVSQLWKLHRVASSVDVGASSVRCSSLLQTLDARSQTGVEGGAFLGAFFFGVGTLIYWLGHLPTEGMVYQVVLATWMLGSIAFTFGAISLGYRHRIMGV
jgi:hypothetical protein